MWLLIIMLNREEYLNDTLQALVELGTIDGVVIDSESLGERVAYEVPIFAGIRLWSRGRRPYSKTIFAIVDEKDAGKEIVKMLKEIDIDLEEPGVARILTLKIESLLGKPPEFEE